MKKIFVLAMVVMLSICFLPFVSAEKPKMSGVELETTIMNGINIWFFGIYVENMGDEIAHNVTLTDVSVEGNLIFNFQESKQYGKDISPGDMTLLDPNSGVIGYGRFNLSMTVACDEGFTSTSSVQGFIIGPAYIIP